MKPTDEEIIDYLLGDIAEPEHSRIEESLFSDDDSFERLSAIENRLVDLYVLNKLSPSERQSFEEKYQSSPRRTAKIAATTEFVHLVNTHNARRKTESPRNLLEELLAFFNAHSLALQGALASLLVVSLIGFGWVLKERTRLRDQNADLEAALRKKEAELQASNRNPTVAERAAIERDRTELAQLEESLKQREENLQSVEGPQATQTIASLVLTSALRNGGGSELKIRSSDKFARLSVKLEGELAESNCMVLEKAGGEEVRKRSVRQSNLKILTMTLPASLFSDRNYVVRVGKLAPDGQCAYSDGFSVTVTKLKQPSG